MNIHQQIEDLLTANFEGLPIPDRLGAASALSTLYHFVVDNDLEQDYCGREPILAAADKCYTALLMSYINCDNAAQATKILLAQADLIFGLQAVPNRRRVDCFLTAATKHLENCVKTHAPSPTPHATESLASIVLTFGGNLPKEAEHFLATCEESQAQTRGAAENRFSNLTNTINQLESEIQSSLLLN